MKGLKDESDLVPADERQLRFAQLGDLLAVEQVGAGGRPIETADDVQQG